MNADEAAAVAAVGIVGRATAVAAAASKSSLAFILGVADDDQASGANFADLAVRSRAAQDGLATENTAANAAAPAAPRATVKKSRICKFENCTRYVVNRGLCIGHGVRGSTKCTVSGCENRAKSRGVCWSHGGGKRCVIEGCRKPAYERNGNVCSLHQAANGVLQKPAKR
ncbi:hypothetical protein BBO99_00001095 [Phytophthora kernoviae]|uniref:WRKY19-like zinc finger domain-containing protein n=2 Tax=Phytophthora kernoviae TaxID=325452 RepID=A0A3R7IG42_9STRA|nr:hypothetical protein G195_002628 [Phytophthora kernoviae 00238/432]KAG2532448.1 hypothetical protein JM16_000361 [Phytophthora kernoviae]KAG2533443.1 hypothetical protein JM18_000277 [Phytophthora kernoviae]RLN06728.1 hypothetical protein BBI17_001066 [Phytophthora kernoviae]RLN84785.1 hypothetical protein BBO99_00001095 [Phytophthora kernoviae]